MHPDLGFWKEAAYNTPWRSVVPSLEEAYTMVYHAVGRALRPGPDDDLDDLPPEVRDWKRTRSVLMDHLYKFDKAARRHQYRMPKGYSDYTEFIERCLFEGCTNTLVQTGLFPPLGDAGRHTINGLRNWVDFGQPLIAPTPELLIALTNTTPPDDITFGDVLWPYPSWCLAMPKGAFQSPAGYDVTYILVRNTRPEDYESGEWDRELTEDEREQVAAGKMVDVRKCNTFHVVVLTDGPCYYRSMTPEDDQPVGEFMEFPDLDRSNLDGEDDVMLKRMITMVFNLALYLMACPDDFDETTLMQRKKGKKILGKKNKREAPTEFWSPNMVGRSYSRSQAEGDGTHASPRTHWRRGHWRRTRVGKGRAEVRINWIKAVLVAANKED